MYRHGESLVERQPCNAVLGRSWSKWVIVGKILHGETFAEGPGQKQYMSLEISPDGFPFLRCFVSQRGHFFSGGRQLAARMFPTKQDLKICFLFQTVRKNAPEFKGAREAAEEKVFPIPQHFALSAILFRKEKATALFRKLHVPNVRTIPGNCFICRLCPRFPKCR